MEKEKILNVTDLTKYLYCQRQFYLEKVEGIKKPVTKEMIEGRIRHEVLELFSKNEKEVINTMRIATDIEKNYLEFLRKLVILILRDNKNVIDEFKIDEGQLTEKIESQIKREIKLRVNPIKNAIEKGFEKEDIWNNLEPKFLSEFSICSESLGLKGRIDRILIEKEKMIPFELKTRKIERVFESDELQLVAYAMLVEDYSDQVVEFGIVESGEIRFQIDINDQKRKKVIEIIKEIRGGISKKFPSNFSKCEKCSYREECDRLS